MGEPIPGELWWADNSIIQVADTLGVTRHPGAIVSTNGISARVLPGSSKPETFKADGCAVYPHEVTTNAGDFGLPLPTYFSRAWKRVATVDFHGFIQRMGTVTASKLGDLRVHSDTVPGPSGGTKP